MSVRLTLSTRNIRGLIANIYAADAVTQRAVRRTVKKWGPRQQQLTAELAPYDVTTGPEAFHMRDNVRLRYSDDGLIYEVGFDAEDFTEAGRPFYPIYTEFGTRFMAARPCVFPARDRIYPEYKADLSANVRAALRRRKSQ
jgi:hypothetical protein